MEVIYNVFFHGFTDVKTMKKCVRDNYNILELI